MVVVAYLDSTHVCHRSAADALKRTVRNDTLAASAINYAELLTGVRIGHHDDTVTRGFFSDLVAAIFPVGPEIAERAAEIRAESRLRLPDALVLATADSTATRPSPPIAAGNGRRP